MSIVTLLGLVPVYVSVQFSPGLVTALLCVTGNGTNPIALDQSVCRPCRNLNGTATTVTNSANVTTAPNTSSVLIRVPLLLATYI